MKEYTEQNPVFSESIRITETSDPAHADNINAAPVQLLQNTLTNRNEIEELKKGNNEVEFDDTGTDIPGGEGPEEVPDPVEALEQITSGKSVPTLIGHIKMTLKGLLLLSQKALDVARGKNRAQVFHTVEELDAWLSVPENTEQLNVGDNLYITATDVPDYWWDGTTKQPLETQKVDLTDYDQKITALETEDRKINENITSLSQKIQSFESAKSEIANSALGKALGVLATGTWAQLLAKLKAVVNRGALNWSGSNTTYSVPAGYYSGGTLDSRPSYNAGMTAADGRANANSVNYKTGYNAGVTAADGRANTNSVNYKTGYDAGVAAADGRANANSANYKAGFAAGAAPKGYEAKVICNPTSLNGSQSASASFNKPSGATRAVVSVVNFSEADNRVVEASVNAYVIAQFCSAHLAASNQGAWLTTFIVDVAGVSSITVTAKPSWPSSVNHYFRSAASVTWF